jgi:hypothetical protein
MELVLKRDGERDRPDTSPLGELSFAAIFQSPRRQRGLLPQVHGPPIQVPRLVAAMLHGFPWGGRAMSNTTQSRSPTRRSIVARQTSVAGA